MWPALLHYLSVYQKLYIPSVGVFSLASEDATLDFANKQLHAPRQAITFQAGEDESLLMEQEQWLKKWKESFSVELIPLTEFGKKMSAHLRFYKTIDLPNLGNVIFQGGVIAFEPLVKEALFEPVHLEKFMQKMPAQPIQVGDTMRTTEEMESELATKNTPIKYKSFDLIAGLILLTAALVWMVYYFYSHPFDIHSLGSLY